MIIRTNSIIPTPLERAAGRLMRAPDHPGENDGEDDDEALDGDGEDDDNDDQSGQSGDDQDNDGQEDDDEQSDSSDDGDSGGKRKPDRNGYEKRIARLTRRNKELQEALAKPNSEKRDPAHKPSDTGAKPKVSDFDNYEDFIEALAEFKADEKLSGYKRQTEADRADSEFLKRLKQGKKSFKDWDDVVTDDIEVSPSMQRAIKDSDYPAEILHYLGKHPEEAENILDMPASKQVLAIGKIEGKIEQKTGKSSGTNGKRTTTSAPDPIKPSSGPGGKIRKSYEDMSFSEFSAARKRETYGARK